LILTKPKPLPSPNLLPLPLCLAHIPEPPRVDHKILIMVYYFTSTVVDPPATIYVGKDKVESERHLDLAFFSPFAH
jgi:hypothetical protein